MFRRYTVNLQGRVIPLPAAFLGDLSRGCNPSRCPLGACRNDWFTPEGISPKDRMGRGRSGIPSLSSTWSSSGRVDRPV